MGQRVVLGFILLATVSYGTELFTYRVERDRLIRDQRGELRIDADGLSYKSDNGNTTLQIPLAEIFEADVSDPRIISVKTYDVLKRNLGGRRAYTFRLLEVRHDEALTRFLAAKLRRPLVGSYVLAESEAESLSAYHRHRLGGCHGRVYVDPAGIRFVSDKPTESRTWRYSEIETVGSMNRFHLRISTLAETYNFDLKKRLPEEQYDLAMRSVYGLPRTQRLDRAVSRAMAPGDLDRNRPERDVEPKVKSRQD